MAFDIHVDAISLSPALEKSLREDLGLWRSDFAGHPKDEESYEPPNHLTCQMETGVEFSQTFDRLLSLVQHDSSMKGYLEGEFIASDVDLDPKEFISGTTIPFRIRRTSLAPGTFRESEVHVTLSRDKSDPRLLGLLREMGLYSAFIEKKYGVAQIFTAQGTRKQIDMVLPSLTEFLGRVGGAVACSVKEERIARWWTSESTLRLPPVIESIEWLG